MDDFSNSRVQRRLLRVRIVGKKAYIKKIIEESKITIAFFLGIYLSFAVYMKDIMTSDYISGYLKDINTRKILLEYIVSGRLSNVILTLVYKIFAIAGVTHFKNIFAIQLTGMLFYAMALSIIWNIFRSIINSDTLANKVTLYVAVLVSVVNPFVVEHFIYGSFDFALGFWGAVFSVYLFMNEQWIRSFIIAFLSVSIYQSNVYYILITLAFFYYFKCIKEDKKFKYLFYRESISLLFCLGVILINIAIQKIAIFFTRDSNIRVHKNVDFNDVNVDRLESLFGLAKWHIGHTFDMLPRNFVLYACFISIIFVILYSARYAKIWQGMMYVFLLFACFSSLFSYGFFYGEYFAQRMLVGIFLILSYALIGIIICTNEIGIEEMVPVGRFIILVIFLVIYSETQLCSTDAFIAQAIDKYEAKAIYREINNYEQMTGIEIKEIATCGGAGYEDNTVYRTDELLKDYNATIPYHRIVYDYWSQGRYINYVNNTAYDSRRMTEEEIDRYFGEYVSPGFFDPDSQLVFDGDTLYWRIY